MFDIHYHGDDYAKVLTKLEELMTLVKADFDSLTTAIDQATDAIATRLSAAEAKIQGLETALANGDPITQEDLAAIRANLNAEVTRLQALGQDPANPVPVEVVNPPAPGPVEVPPPADVPPAAHDAVASEGQTAQ